MADAARSSDAAAPFRRTRMQDRPLPRLAAHAVVLAAVLAAHFSIVSLIGALRPTEGGGREMPRVRVTLIAPMTATKPATPTAPLTQQATDRRPTTARVRGRAQPERQGRPPEALTSATAPSNASHDARAVATPPVAADRAASEPPLRLDADVMRRAARGARSDLDRRIAVDRTPVASRDEVLSARAAQAGVPSCLAADATRHEALPLGGLLGLPVLVHAALSGKCR